MKKKQNIYMEVKNKVVTETAEMKIQMDILFLEN